MYKVPTKTQVPSLDEIEKLAQRIGHLHLKQRLGIEIEHRDRLFGLGLKLLNIENWAKMHHIIHGCLRLLTPVYALCP